MINTPPLVSVCCLTYNHDKYIGKALDSILIQKTNFPIEIMVHDDASSDGTRDIIIGFAKKHPEIIRPVFQENNLMKSGTGLFQIYTNYVLPLAKGKYIAICECDDYWIDSLKLQKQVDFLESNPDFSICFHNVGFLENQIIDFEAHKNYYKDLLSNRDVFGIEDLIKGNFIPNCSVVYRRNDFCYPEVFNNLLFADWPLHIHYSLSGKIKYLDEIMAIYQVHQHGLWSGLSDEDKQYSELQFYKSLLQFISKPQLIDYTFEVIDLRFKTSKTISLREIFEVGYNKGKQHNQLKIESQNRQLNLINSDGSRKIGSIISSAVKSFLHGNLKNKIIFNKLFKFSRKIPSPKVSIITPCYNHGKYIVEMLDSVMQQTFTNFEVIIVNDGSTDNTADILNRIRHHKVRIIHTENFGPAHARNQAIENASGELIINLDADDKIAPDFLQRCVEIMTTKPHIGIVYSNVELFGNDKGPFILNDYSFENMLRANCIVANACFRKADWTETEGYSSAMKCGYEDFDFWLSILELGRDVYKIKEPLVFYRTYERPEDCRSGRRKQNPDQMEAVVIQAFQRHRSLYKKVPHIYNEFSDLEYKFNQKTTNLKQ